MAKWDPDKTFVTAQRIFGGVRPLDFFIMLLAEIRFDCHIVLRGRAARVGEVEVVRCITSRSDQTGKYFSYNFGVVFSLLTLFSRLLFSSLLVFSLPFSSSPFVFSSLFFSSRLVSHLVFSFPFFSSRLVSPRLVLGSRRFETRTDPRPSPGT